jgi:diketogulonate reductase-like aldo/keto reductase
MNASPSSGESVPAVGLGSWITFNVGDDPVLLDSCAAVMAAFFRAGGNMIDSSPMYGSSQTTIGYGLEKLNRVGSVFCAEKVWTSDAGEGRDQIDRSKTNWGAKRFDLVQVHNLVAWRDHLPILQAMKENGDIRYVGITTSHGRRHDALEEVMINYPIDFVQLTYNPVDREAENRLLPMAGERGIAVIVNRPFRRGILPDRLANLPVPSWADAIKTKTWAQIILKFIISHPFVTCAIPATTRVDHVLENVGAASEPFPDEDLRARLVEAVLNS